LFRFVVDAPITHPDWSVVTIAGSYAIALNPGATDAFNPNSPPGALTQIAEPAVE